MTEDFTSPPAILGHSVTLSAMVSAFIPFLRVHVPVLSLTLHGPIFWRWTVSQWFKVLLLVDIWIYLYFFGTGYEVLTVITDINEVLYVFA